MFIYQFQVTEEPFEEMEDSDLWHSLEEDEDEDGLVFFVLQESTGYMAPTLRALAVIHTVISFVCVIGYYCLKVSKDLTNTSRFSHTGKKRGATT